MLLKEVKYCSNHPDKPVKCKGLCRNCYEKQLLINNPNYASRQKINSLRYQEKHREKISKYNKEKSKNPEYKEKKYITSIKRIYNVSEEEYKNLVKECNNSCKLCGKKPYEGKRLHLDHNHKTGKVRGLLCTRCNWYLHTIEKDPDILEKIKNYLKDE